MMNPDEIGGDIVRIKCSVPAHEYGGQSNEAVKESD
ncbi:unannotated protein [freshwater metagenome]|uniref:Unannotated protein n=1 Tax=freshwater metagenome TaxID=449393 RepID=A0A6J7DMU8_9ZZZZ